MGMKENLGKAAEWGKKNPIIVLLLFIGIVWLLMRQPLARPADAPLPALPGRITGQTFPQGGGRPETHVPVRPEEYFQTPEPIAPFRPDAVFLPAAGGRGVLDYHVVGHQAYQQAIAAAHTAWVPGTPDRITDAVGRILTAERGFETPQAVIERQQVRFDRAMARGDIAAADMVRRETELATGIRTGW